MNVPGYLGHRAAVREGNKVRQRSPKQRRVRVDTGRCPSTLLLRLPSPPFFSLLPVLKEAMSRYLLYVFDELK